jgi:hypothetical protein
VKWLDAHFDRSAVQLNAFTVRILDRHASIHFRLNLATRARSRMPITSNATFASTVCGTRIFAVCLSAAALFDSLYLSGRPRSNSSSSPALALPRRQFTSSASPLAKLTGDAKYGCIRMVAAAVQHLKQALRSAE